MAESPTPLIPRSPILWRTAIVVLGAIVLVIAVLPAWIASRSREPNAVAGLTITSPPLGRHRSVERVQQVEFRGPASRAGLRVGDTLVTIQGIDIQDRDRLRALARSISAGDTVTYVVRRAGSELVIPVVLEAMAERGPIRTALFVAVGVVFVIIAGFVAWRMPFDLRALLFFGLGLATSVSMWATLGVHMADLTRGISPDELLSASSLAALVAGALSGAAFLALLLHFALVFPRRHPVLESRPVLSTWVYATPLGCISVFMMLLLIAGRDEMHWGAFSVIAASALALGFASLQLGRATGSLWRRFGERPWATIAALAGLTGAVGLLIHQIPRDLPLGRSVRLVYGLGTSLGSALGFAAYLLAVPILVTLLLLTSYRAAGLEERQQIRWPLWSIIISALGTVAVSTVFAVLGAVGIQGLRYIWISDLITLPLTLLIPVGFAVGIMRYRLMDLDVVIRKTVIYGVVTAILVAVYFAVVAGIGGWLASALGVRSQWITVIGTLAVAAAFVPVRSRIQVEIDRRFFRTRYEAAEALRRLGERLSHGGDAATLARIACEELHQTLAVRASAVLVREGSTRRLMPASTLGISEEVGRRLTMRLDGELESALGGSRVTPVSRLPAEALNAARAAHAHVVVTIRRPTGMLGVILVGGRLSDADFEETDRDYLESLANQVGMALGNLGTPARRRELEEAREIQARLLPQTLPRVRGLDIAAHWQPAQEVAGDYYDVLPLDQDRIAVCIADVTGKGMPAALLMSNLQATVKTFATPGVAPRVLCERINRVMAEAVGPGRFVTLFFGILDLARNELCYTNAGHNPPLVLRRDGGVESLEIGGTLMGPFSEATFVQAEVSLMPGDRLVLYTDGVTEAMDPAGELFGEDRLRRVGLEAAAGGAAHVQQRVLERVTEFCGGVFQDDATILVVAVEGREGPEL